MESEFGSKRTGFTELIEIKVLVMNIRITETKPKDVKRIREWLSVDPWHKDDSRNVPELMVTGNGLLSFCLRDDEGPLVYVKLTEDGDLIRIAMQFAPESIVSRKRLAIGLSEVGIPVMKIFAEHRKYKGLVFESVSPTLIAFGDRYGFKSVGNNDYALIFEEKRDV